MFQTFEIIESHDYEPFKESLAIVFESGGGAKVGLSRTKGEVTHSPTFTSKVPSTQQDVDNVKQEQSLQPAKSVTTQVCNNHLQSWILG